MSRLFYKGNGKTIGPLAPMDSSDASFWAGRHDANQRRLERIAAKKENKDGLAK